MENINYILSSHFDYSKMICDDAGPGYALRMGWKAHRLSHIESRGPGPIVIDNRLTPNEFPIVRALVEAMSGSPIFLKIVDVRLDTIYQDYYRFVLALIRHPNVFLVGPYEKIHFTALAEEIAGRPLYTTVPYAYATEREVPAGGHRCARLFFSGALHPLIYPDRWRLHRRLQFIPLARLLFRRLGHPGYADIGQRPRHSVVGNLYLQHAASCLAMWVDGGSDKVELLKFSECAYAGCAPVGVPASSLPPEASRCVLPLPHGFEFSALLKLLRSPADLTTRAVAYRQAMRSARSQERCNSILREAWTNAYASLPR